MLFLKANDSVKFTMVKDLSNAFQLIKQQETRIFCEGAWSQKVLLFGICQFKHCLKESEKEGGIAKCPILTKQYRSSNYKIG